MNTYYVPARWRVMGYHLVEANNIEEVRERIREYDFHDHPVFGKLDELPPPSQEENNADYEVGQDGCADFGVRRATAQEVKHAREVAEQEKRAEATAAALRECVGAGRAVLAAWEKGDLAAAVRKLDAALAKAAALGVKP